MSPGVWPIWTLGVWLAGFMYVTTYAFQYPLDFGAAVTHDSCLTAVNFRSIAAYFDKKNINYRLRNRRRSFKKGTLPTTKKGSQKTMTGQQAIASASSK